MINSVGIIGLGLIGGSIAKALRAQFPSMIIVAHDERSAALQNAVSEQIITKGAPLSQIARETDLLILATPLSTYSAIFRALSPTLSAQHTLTDAGSLKHVVNLWAKETLPFPANFIGAHPIAGSDQSGYAASSASLFEGKRVILTPSKKVNEESYQKVKSLWSALSDNVRKMDSRAHDNLYARVSHALHFFAFALNRISLTEPVHAEWTAYLRLSRSEITMWRDIGFYNSEAIAKVIKHYRTALRKISELSFTKWNAQTVEHSFDTPPPLPCPFSMMAFSAARVIAEECDLNMRTYAGPAFLHMTEPLNYALPICDDREWKQFLLQCIQVNSALMELQQILKLPDMPRIEKWLISHGTMKERG